MHENLRSLQVTQEVVSETMPFVSPLDETGYVGQHETAIVAQVNHAKMWCEGRERVVRDSWFRRGRSGEQCRLSYVGKTYKTHISE